MHRDSKSDCDSRLLLNRMIEKAGTTNAAVTFSTDEFSKMTKEQGLHLAEWDVRPEAETWIGRGTDLDRRSRIIAFGPHATVYISNGVKLRNCRIVCRGRQNSIYIGEESSLKNVTIEVKGKYCSAIFGKGITWEDGICMVGGEDTHVVVGDDGLFASQIMIRTDDGHGIFDRETKRLMNECASVTIGEHVWLGRNSTVSKGTVIGRGSVLAAGSLATKKLDSYSIYAGVPAKKVRTDVTWSRTYSHSDIPEKYW